MAQSSAKKTIGQFARRHGLEPKAVVKAATQHLDLPSGRARDVQYRLSPAEQQTLRRALGLGDSVTDDEDADEAVSDALEEGAESLDGPRLRPDPPTPRDALSFGVLHHRLYVHEEVFTRVRERLDQQKKLGVALQQLGAHGHTSVVKSCRGVNRGWRRSPFGGNNGRQYYLWWARKDDPPVKHLDALAGGDIVVRAVRHHDDHDPLTLDDLDGCLPLGAADVQDESYVASPWTSPQRRFIEGEAPVRFVLGRPGAGKTSVLWAATEARGEQNVLYLTWSSALRDKADERFRAFAPVGVRSDCRSYRELLGALTGDDVAHLPLDLSRERFRAALSQYCGDGADVWSNNATALHAELRAQLIGRATPIGMPEHDGLGLVRLDDDAYIEARRAALRLDGAREAVRTFEILAARGCLPDIFPELFAATRALERLAVDALPDGFETFDRVVIDEAQDLTLLDLTVVVELCRAIGRARGVFPWLLVAGDEGQTVRPSGFDWGRLGDLVTERLAPAEKYPLDENLRCPARIAAVIERASAAYRHLDKGNRPAGQVRREGGDQTNAQLYTVEVTESEAAELVAALDDHEGVVVVTCHDERPAWLDDERRDMVSTPADTKGLEYQSVVVLEPGRFMAGLARFARKRRVGRDESAVRTRIDQFRVALSRATESLTFVDVDPEADERAHSTTLLGDAAPYDADDLLTALTSAELDIDERVDARVREANAILDERPRRAWMCAVQAVKLLGDPALPDGVVSPDRREAAHRAVLMVAARLVVSPTVPERISRAEVLTLAEESIACLGVEEEKAAFAELVEWCARPLNPPIALLDAAVRLPAHVTWLRGALAPIAQSLQRALSIAPSDVRVAAAFRGDIEQWLKLVGYAGDRAQRADELRRDAFETLFAAGRYDDAEVVLEAVAAPVPLEWGLLSEATGRYVHAAMDYEEAGRPPDALRCWRLAGEWQRALRVAERGSVEHADLSWLTALETVLEGRPADLDARLTDTERATLGELIEQTFALPPRRTRGRRR